MLEYIAFAILFAILGILPMLLALACFKALIYDGKDLPTIAFSCIFTVTFILCVVCSIVSIKACINTLQTETITQETELVSVSSGSSTSGSIKGNAIYVYGSVTTEPSYTYYCKHEDGGYKSASIPASNTVIYYIEEGEKPYILTTFDKYVNYEVEDEQNVELIEETIHYELHVPEGSIESTFEF